MTERKTVKILFPEGSSLSARQAITALGKEGYRVDICDPNPLCICRFSRYVNKFYKCPVISTDPEGYYNFIMNILGKNKYDVLFPVHEQSYLFSKKYKSIARHVNIAIADFNSFFILQSKIEFIKLLQQLNIPHAPSKFVKTKQELLQQSHFPYYAKVAYGTGGHGTWRVDDISKLNEVITALESEGYLTGDSEILVQTAETGVLSVAQSLFSKGSLIGCHCYQLISEGVGGSASARIGVFHPKVIEHLKIIGRRLNWHGCFMLDYIYDAATETPYYIEANPRTGETMNAIVSGFNLPLMLTKLSMGEEVTAPEKQKYGVKTHSLMATLLGIANRGGTRRELIAETWKSFLKRKNYRNSYEELTNIREDLYSVIPFVFVFFRLLINPASVARISGKTISNYSISENTVKIINEMQT